MTAEMDVAEQERILARDYGVRPRHNGSRERQPKSDQNGRGGA